MKTAAIIAEYNPFHMGHRYHINATRELTGADYVIAVMSGDFVQRGEPACTDKYFRTRMALMGGADLVIELPVFYAIASAESFAAGGVALLHELGCIDHLSFGSEWAGLSDYEPYVRLFAREGEAYQSLLKSYLKEGVTYPVARSRAAAALLPDACPERFLKEPNHILGLEYLKALSRSGSDIKPIVVIRKDARYHDEQLQCGAFSSAAAIRKACESLWKPDYRQTEDLSLDQTEDLSLDQTEDLSLDQIGDLSKDQTRDLRFALGDHAGDFLSHILAGETVRWDDLMPLLDYAMLMQKGRSDLEKTDHKGRQESGSSFSDDNKELLRHIRKHYEAGLSFEGLLNILHSKNRTDTALKRTLLHILLNDNKDHEVRLDPSAHLSTKPPVSPPTDSFVKAGGDPVFYDLFPVPYARVLGFRKSAAPLLKVMQLKSAIPLIQRPARGRDLFRDKQTAASLYRLDIRAATLYEQIAARKSRRPVIHELARQQVIL